MTREDKLARALSELLELVEVSNLEDSGGAMDPWEYDAYKDSTIAQAKQALKKALKEEKIL